MFETQRKFVDYSGIPLLAQLTEQYNQLEKQVKKLPDLLFWLRHTKKELLIIPYGIQVTEESRERVDWREREHHVAGLQIYAFGDGLYPHIVSLVKLVKEIAAEIEKANVAHYRFKTFPSHFARDIAMHNVLASVELILKALELQRELNEARPLIGRERSRQAVHDDYAASDLLARLPSEMPEKFNYLTESLLSCLAHKGPELFTRRFNSPEEFASMVKILERDGWTVTVQNPDYNTYTFALTRPPAAR
jgi:hypothetical protein